MKKILLIFLGGFNFILCPSQTWTYSQGDDAFDGKYRTCSVQGVGYEFPYTKPLFVVNVFKGDNTKPNIYLTGVPYGVCENNKILIKLDDEKIIYQPLVTTTNTKEDWFLDFNTFESVEDSVLQTLIMYVFPSDKNIYFRKNLDPNSSLILKASLNDTIYICNRNPTGYWFCIFKNHKGYVSETSLPDLSLHGKVSNKLHYVPYMTEIKNNKGTDNFIKELKTHSFMHVRLLNDCIKSDFEFSLKGSSVALNFVFSQ